MKISNIFKHFNTIIKHKWYVFIYSCKAGIPFRGLVHDLSKFSFEEFFESSKYFQGNRSPIAEAKRVNGYSKAWLHHKGRNKHHWQYWYDVTAEDKTPVIPYKYTVEMICDSLAAGKVYKKKQWTKSHQIEFWRKEKKKIQLNEKIQNVLTETYEMIEKEGINNTISKRNLKEIYDRNVNT